VRQYFPLRVRPSLIQKRFRESYQAMGLRAALLVRLVATSFVVWGLTIGICAAQQQTGEVPFGDQVSPAVTKYNRLRPNIATAGPLKNGAIVELKSLGFATILDLRGPNEGTDAEKAAVEKAAMRYLNIPVTATLPSDEQVAAFAHIVESTTNFPLLIHCASANRVGAIWTLYLLRRGVPLSIAIDEGRTTGMLSDRENAILEDRRLSRPRSGQQ
jgi:uncharacterized protein (TIGR01244 family)